MFDVGEYVVYRTNVCKVVELEKGYIDNKDYYILEPVNDLSLTVKIPTDKSANLIRNVISEKEVKQIIEEIPNIDIIDNDIRNIENEYKKLLKSGGHKDLIKIIKTAYLRNEERLEANKKISETDNNYFKKAEKILYTEFSIALNLSYEDTKEYVVNRVKVLNEMK
ncbi:MAG TPA: hypothetical protein GXZ95_00510 [Mollicutes bacterium]|nr:hypothetical protein [Mollicutes bacterium]